MAEDICGRTMAAPFPERRESSQSAAPLSTAGGQS